MAATVPSLQARSTSAQAPSSARLLAVTPVVRVPPSVSGHLREDPALPKALFPQAQLRLRLSRTRPSTSYRAPASSDDLPVYEALGQPPTTWSHSDAPRRSARS